MRQSRQSRGLGLAISLAALLAPTAVVTPPAAASTTSVDSAAAATATSADSAQPLQWTAQPLQEQCTARPGWPVGKTFLIRACIRKGRNNAFEITAHVFNKTGETHTAAVWLFARIGPDWNSARMQQVTQCGLGMPGGETLSCQWRGRINDPQWKWAVARVVHADPGRPITERGTVWTPFGVR